MAYIYLGEKSGEYDCKDTGGVTAKIDVSQELYDKCCTYQIIKYNIEYLSSNYSSESTTFGSHLYISTGHSNPSNPYELRNQYIYSYFPPVDTDIVYQVDSYYLSTGDPFALVFTTGGGEKRYYAYDDLVRQTTSNTLTGTVIQDGNLCKLLHSSCKKPGGCKTFKFTAGTGADEGVVKNERNIGNGKFKKVIFTPNPSAENGSVSELHSDNLFTERTTNDLENMIDESYLGEVKNLNFSAVIVYYTGSVYNPPCLAILIEFVKGCETIHIGRTCNKPPIWLKRKVNYYDDNELMTELSSIKEDSETAITYRLDRNHNGDGYDKETIEVTQELITSNLGYNIYKHKFMGESSGQLPILLYKDKQIDPVININITYDNKLNESDTDFFNEISTYSLSTSPLEHLLIRLTKNGNNYYLYRFGYNGFRWKQLGLDEFAEFGVLTKQEMEQKKRETSRGGLGNQIEEILKDSKKSKLFLEEVSFTTKSIILAIEKKSVSYGKREIEEIILKQGSENHVPPVDIDNNTITPRYCTPTISNFLEPNGYKVYKHDLRSAGESAKEKSHNSNLYLRFYLYEKRIMLYSSSGERLPLEYRDGMNDLYVYYYGDSDPRPLLLRYGNHAYRPNSLPDYDKKWVKEDKIKNCLCLNEDDDKKLLDVLSYVVGILNAVQLKRPEFRNLKSFPKTEYKYLVQKFNGDIRIKVTCENKKCYRVYTHDHNGIEGRAEGFRLGNINHELNGPDGNSLKYTSPKPLSKVSAYYSLYDIELKHPLLVVLEFKVIGKNDVEYYKLSDKKSKKWAKIKSEDEGGTNDDSSFLKKLKELEDELEKTPSSKIPDKLQDHIEKKAYNIRSDLGIKFEKKENAGTLFDPKNCKEDRINWVAIGAGTGGGVVAVGTVVTAGVLVSNKLATGAAAAAATTIAL